VSFIESVRFALGAILLNKLRASLTMLGVTIGVGAVVAMMGIATGKAEDDLARIRALGSNLLVVFPMSRRGAASLGIGAGASLKLSDADEIRKTCPSIKEVSAEVRSSAQAKAGNRNLRTSLLGCEANYAEVHNMQLVEGRMFLPPEVRAGAKVCILGDTVASELFGEDFVVGKLIRLNTHSFEVIGRFAPKGGQGFRNPDDVVYMPITTLMHRMLGQDHINSLTTEVRDESLVPSAKIEVERALMRKRPNVSDELEFRVFDQTQLTQTSEEQSRANAMLLGGIAVVSLIVGGIGIMNIMLVSVTERTREIGLRKAVGATSSSVLSQFLLEAVLICVAGGVLGIAAGVVGAKMIAGAEGPPPIVTPMSVVMAFAFSIAVGVFFGLYPAMRASRLTPIEALRHE
jgi:putative ABC transport system permease protein